MPAFLKCTEYEEAISNGKKLKLFNDLDKSIGNWRKVDSILKRVLNTDTPKLSWYRTELQRYIEFKRGKGRLSDLCSGLEKKFEQMKNEKGYDRALLHLAICIIKRMYDWEEIHLAKTTNEEESEEAVIVL